MKRPYFSVVIDNYNYGRFVRECLQSIVDQDMPKDEVEILFVDDGSTDDSVAVASSFKDRVTVLQQKNAGQAAAFNTGMAAAKGQVIALMDSDDYWEPNKLSVVAEKMKDPAVKITQHYLRDVTRDRKPMGNPLPSWPEKFTLQDFAEGRFSSGATTSLCFHKSVLDHFLPVPTTVFSLYDEYILDFGMVHADVYNIPRVLGYHRIHGGNNWAQGYRSPKKLEGSIAETYQLLEMLKPQLASRGLSFSKQYLDHIEMDMARRRIMLASYTQGRGAAFAEWRRQVATYGATSAFGAFRAATTLLAVVSPALYFKAYELYGELGWGARARGLLAPSPVEKK